MHDAACLRSRGLKEYLLPTLPSAMCSTCRPIPRCIVKIQDFDDQGTLQENIHDYVISETVAAEMERLVDRVVASCIRHEAGEGHYLHGSFGSGKSHFSTQTSPRPSSGCAV
jgi:hypothetical protein